MRKVVFFNLEMQTTYAGVAEMMRFEFYGARALNNQLDSSEKYKDLKPVYHSCLKTMRKMIYWNQRKGW